MEGQDDFTSNDWSWVDQLISGPLADTPAAQPEAPMELGDGNGLFSNSSPAQNNTIEATNYFSVGSEPASRALSENSGYFTSGDGSLFAHAASEGFSLFVDNDGNPFHDVPPNGDSADMNLPPKPDGVPTAVIPLEQRMESLERRMEGLEHMNQLIYLLTDAIQKAMGKWSMAVNKTLLEIAKAVGIPLYYKDGVAGVAPSYDAGASIRYTTGPNPSSEPETDHADGEDAPEGGKASKDGA